MGDSQNPNAHGLMDAVQKKYLKNVVSGRLCGDHLRVSLLGSGFGANIVAFRRRQILEIFGKQFGVMKPAGHVVTG